MPDPTGTSQIGVSVTEAAVMLGISPNTVRRWVASGRLRSERTARPQGDVIRVFVDQEDGQVPKQVPPAQVPGDVPNEVPAAPLMQVPDAVRAEAMASLISAAIVPVLAPLVAQIDAHRQTVERQAQEIGQLREDRGRLTADLERAAATVVSLSNVLDAHTAPESAPASSEPAPVRWRSWWPATLALLALLVSCVALVWPR